MPYFKNNTTNTLFIHIPKTGGSSIENYLSNFYNVKLDKNSLVSRNQESFERCSLQHLDLSTIMNHFKVEPNNLFIFTVVRNPYDRFMSALFYHNLIHPEMTPKEILKAAKNCIENIDEYNLRFDQHFRPQCKYIDEKYNVKILHTETLKQDMIKLGFNNFLLNSNQNKHKIKDYTQYLFPELLKLINEYYKKDFETFDYPMKQL
jgi:hypothetical protein